MVLRQLSSFHAGLFWLGETFLGATMDKTNFCLEPSDRGCVLTDDLRELVPDRQYLLTYLSGEAVVFLVVLYLVTYLQKCRVIHMNQAVSHELTHF